MAYTLTYNYATVIIDNYFVNDIIIIITCVYLPNVIFILKWFIINILDSNNNKKTISQSKYCSNIVYRYYFSFQICLLIIPFEDYVHRCIS